ncbi:hypothetical protein D3C81_1662000 [compost metagenome]
MNHATTDQGKAARRHTVAVEAEELVVQQLDQGQPQLGERLGRHAGLGLFEQLWIDADRTQVRIAHVRAFTQGMKHGLKEVHGDCIAIAHGGFRCLC